MSRSRRTLHCIAALVACAVLCAPLSAETLREEFSETYALRAGGEVSIRNVNGSIDLGSWERDEVLVEATKVVKTMGRSRAEEALEKLEIEIEHSGNTLRIKTRFPGGTSGVVGWLFGRRVDTKVSYRLTLPREVNLDVHTVNGNVTIESVSGVIDARTTNGQIRILEARGKASALTTNGSIRAEFRQVDRESDCVFRTTNGGITVWVAEDVGVDVAASTVNGAVTTDFPVLVSAGSDRWRRKSLKGEINGGGGHFTLHTVNGSIQLRKLEAE